MRKYDSNSPMETDISRPGEEIDRWGVSEHKVRAAKVSDFMWKGRGH